jgi:hypothetical protein
MAPRLPSHLLRHSLREARRPLLARIRGDDVGDCGFGDQVGVETYVILKFVSECILCNEKHGSGKLVLGSLNLNLGASGSRDCAGAPVEVTHVCVCVCVCALN